jgi:hypothetical protein
MTIKIGDSVRVRHVGPKPSQHNDEVFGSLGVSKAETLRRRESGVL